MTDEELREVLAEEYAHHYGPNALEAAAIAAMRRVAAQVRAETVEEAAMVADGWLHQFGSKDIQFISAGQFASDAVADIADAIRALLNRDGG